MAFAIRNLSVLAYANGFTLWHYKAAADGLLGVKEPGYFADAADLLSGGDMILVSAPDGAGVICVVPGDEGGTPCVAPLAA